MTCEDGAVFPGDTRLDAVYGAPGEECCACSGEPCNNPDPVSCGCWWWVRGRRGVGGGENIVLSSDAVLD